MRFEQVQDLFQQTKYFGVMGTLTVRLRNRAEYRRWLKSDDIPRD